MGSKIGFELDDDARVQFSLLNTVQFLIDESKTSVRFYLSGSSARKLKRGYSNISHGTRGYNISHEPVRYRYKKGDFPNAEWISERTVSLPLSAKLSDGDVKDVIHAVRKALPPI